MRLPWMATRRSVIVRAALGVLLVGLTLKRGLNYSFSPGIQLAKQRSGSAGSAIYVEGFAESTAVAGTPTHQPEASLDELLALYHAYKLPLPPEGRGSRVSNPVGEPMKAKGKRKLRWTIWDSYSNRRQRIIPRSRWREHVS